MMQPTGLSNFHLFDYFSNKMFFCKLDSATLLASLARLEQRLSTSTFVVVH